MKSLFKPIFLLCLVAIVAIGCKKDDLPKPTTKGANTYGCKINGKTWVPEGGNLSNIKPLIAKFSDNKLRIEAKTVNKSSDTSIRIYIENVSNIGEYAINYNTNVPPFGTSYTNHGIYEYIDKAYVDPITNRQYKYTFYSTKANHIGKVKITRLDTNAKIVSGTFEFTAEDRDAPGQTVNITHGRFDTRWE